jgi:glycosyltransferase involved in cell wall biosynthesis
MTGTRRILQVCPRYWPDIGGLEEHVRCLSERLAGKYEVTVATTDPSGKLPDEETLNKVEVRRFKSWAPNESFFFSRKLKGYLKDNSSKYDIVHAHGYHAFPALYVAQTKNGNKMVFTPHYHGSGHNWFRNFLHKPYKIFGNGIFKKSDRVISVSDYEKTMILKRFKIPEEKITLVPNGVNLEEFKNIERRKSEHRKVLSVGRIEEYKGMQYIIKSLPYFREDIKVIIVGKGPYKKRLVALATKLGVSSRTEFYQDVPREQLLQMYASSDLFVLLSKHEAYGITVAEALASRLPCIVARQSALQDWIDNKNCFGVDYPVDPKHLAALVNELAGRPVSEAELTTWDDAARRTVQVYETCFESGGRVFGKDGVLDGVTLR